MEAEETGLAVFECKDIETDLAAHKLVLCIGRDKIAVLEIPQGICLECVLVSR